MFWKILDKVKGVAIGAGAASLLALVGIFLLGASLAATIAIWLPWPAALGLAALTFLTIAALAMWISVRPSGKDADGNKKNDAHHSEHDDITSAASALVDLPLEAAKKMVAERPVAAIVLVSGLGFLIARKPEVALKMVDKIIERFTGGMGMGPGPGPTA